MEDCDLLCAINESQATAPELAGALVTKARQVVEANIENGRIGSCLLYVAVAEKATSDELDAIKEQLGSSAVKIRKASKIEYVTRTGAGRSETSFVVQDVVSRTLAKLTNGLVALNEEDWELPNDKDTMMNRKTGTRHSKEEAEYLEHVAKMDAQITDRVCPNCGKPCPTYRKTCKHCAAFVGRA